MPRTSRVMAGHGMPRGDGAEAGGSRAGRHATHGPVVRAGSEAPSRNRPTAIPHQTRSGAPWSALGRSLAHRKRARGGEVRLPCVRPAARRKRDPPRTTRPRPHPESVCRWVQLPPPLSAPRTVSLLFPAPSDRRAVAPSLASVATFWRVSVSEAVDDSGPSRPLQCPETPPLALSSLEAVDDVRFVHS
jgi:hypothetical protein